jgi:hypothetical protein
MSAGDRPGGPHDRQRLLVRDGQRWDQELLRSRSVLVCGVGNIGDPLAIILARLGFARVDCLDADRVETPNLSRGVTAAPADLGRPKAAVVSEAIARLCPDVATTPHVGDLLGDWPCDFFGRYHLVMLATHDPTSRLFVNRMVHRFGPATLAIVEGALTDWSFSVQTILPGRSPCYECAFDPDFVDDDRWQGCGGVVAERDVRPAATNGPTGMAAAAHMANEAGLVGAGLRPSWADARYEFDGDRGTARIVRRSFRDTCGGHVRVPLAEQVWLPGGADLTVGALRENVAAERGVRPDAVRLFSPRLMTERILCQCGYEAAVGRPHCLPLRPRCDRCGSDDPDEFSVRTFRELTTVDGVPAGDESRRLAHLGLPDGEIVEAYVRDGIGAWTGPLHIHTASRE